MMGREMSQASSSAAPERARRSPRKIHVTASRISSRNASVRAERNIDFVRGFLRRARRAGTHRPELDDWIGRFDATSAAALDFCARCTRAHEALREF
jgi:hypothetical protein